MSDVAVEIQWDGGQRFEGAGRSGAAVLLDGRAAEGTTPPEMLLMSLAACMGIDVVDILEKMRVPLEGLTVRAEGDRRAEPPRHYTAVRLTYRTEGLPPEERHKLQRAIDLSRDTYCSVLHTLRPDLEISFRIETG